MLEIQHLSGRKVKNPEIIRKFIVSENATKFYIDGQMQSYIQPERTVVYLWLDSGFVDSNGQPIIISLHRSGCGFAGHYTGTFSSLSSIIKRNAKNIRLEIE